MATSRFVAYIADSTTCYLFEGRDDSRGISGTLRGASQILAEADELLDLEQQVYAHLGKEPADLVYITDDQLRVYRSLINEKYHQQAEAAGKRLCLAWSIVAFVVLAMMQTPASVASVIGLVVAISLYLLMVRFHIYNEIESAFASLIAQFLVVLACRTASL